MQIIGTPSEHGFSREDIEAARVLFEKQGYKCNVVNLSEYAEREVKDALILVVKRGVDCLIPDTEDKHSLYKELIELDWDSKAFMYGRVVSKHARHNLCFSDQPQDPDYENGKGRVISWEKLPLLSTLRKNLGIYFKEAEKL